MRRILPRFGAIALAVAVLTACGGGGGGTTGNNSSEAPKALGPITATGEGVSLNDEGGQALKLNDPIKGGSLRVGMIAPLETLDPTHPLNTPGTEVAWLVYDTLMRYQHDGTVVPELAESMETEDGGLTWTMKLPKGVKFHDGTPFNAAAVVAHLERLGGPKSRSGNAGDVRKIKSMKTPDDHTIVFELHEAWTAFDTVFAPAAYGSAAMVPSPAAVKKWGDEYALHPVGVGPFTVESFKPGGDVVLKRNPDYRIEGEPYLDELVYVTATDTQARLAALQAGNLDIAMTQAASDFAKAEAAGLRVLRQPTYSYYNLLFNLKKAPFDDVRFRKAVIMALDLDGLSKAVFEGLQPAAKGILPSVHPMRKDTGWPAYNPEEAKKLVEEYTKETGNKAEFQLTTTSPPEFQRQAAVMQQMLADVGIKVNIDVGDQPTMVTQANSGNYQAQHRYVGFNSDFLRGMELNFHSESRANAGQAGNPAIDELLAKGKKAKPEERAAIAEQLQVELTKWLPIVPLIEHTAAFIVGPKVGGFPGQTSGSSVFDARKLWVAQK